MKYFKVTLDNGREIIIGVVNPDIELSISSTTNRQVNKIKELTPNTEYGYFIDLLIKKV